MNPQLEVTGNMRLTSARDSLQHPLRGLSSQTAVLVTAEMRARVLKGALRAEIGVTCGFLPERYKILVHDGGQPGALIEKRLTQLFYQAEQQVPI